MTSIWSVSIAIVIIDYRLGFGILAFSDTKKSYIFIDVTSLFQNLNKSEN